MRLRQQFREARRLIDEMEEAVQEIENDCLAKLKRTNP